MAYFNRSSGQVVQTLPHYVPFNYLNIADYGFYSLLQAPFTEDHRYFISGNLYSITELGSSGNYRQTFSTEPRSLAEIKIAKEEDFAAAFLELDTKAARGVRGVALATYNATSSERTFDNGTLDEDITIVNQAEQLAAKNRALLAGIKALEVSTEMTPEEIKEQALAAIAVRPITKWEDMPTKDADVKYVGT